MPVLLLSFKKNSNGHIMFHGFLAPNEREAGKDLEAHASVCPQFGPAHREGKTIEQAIDIDSLPEFDEESIGEFCDDLFGLEDEADEEIDDEGETGDEDAEDDEET